MINIIKEDLKIAMRNKDKVKINTLRGLISIFNNSDSKNDESLITKILKKEAKKRKEAISLYKESNRKDLMENELEELKILESYMPAQIPDEELEDKINKLSVELFSDSKPELGILIKNSIDKFSESSDNGTISRICKKVIGDK